MKLVIKHQDKIKLFSREISFKALREFAEKQFGMKGENYIISFKDQDGDEISLFSERDVQNMLELNLEREYIKISLFDSQIQSPVKVVPVPEGSPVVGKDVKDVKDVKEVKDVKKVKEVEGEIKAKECEGGRGWKKHCGNRRGKRGEGRGKEHNKVSSSESVEGESRGWKGKKDACWKGSRGEEQKGQDHGSNRRWGKGRRSCRKEAQDAAQTECKKQTGKPCEAECQQATNQCDRDLHHGKEGSEEKHHRGHISSHSPSHGRKFGHCESKGRKFHMMKEMVERRIAEAVDERINALLPCLKEQLAKVAVLVPEGETVHKDISCLACKASPVAGVYYECPVCYKFHLCSKCEEVTPHPHNMLKIKHPEQQERKCPWKGWRRGHRDQSSESHHGRRHCKRGDRSQECHQERRKGHQSWRRMRQFSKMFGGKPEDYKDFIECRSEMNCWEILRAYVVENKLNEQQITEKFVNWRAKKLARNCHKSEEECVAFVRQHMGAGWNELQELAEEEDAPKKVEKLQCKTAKTEQEIVVLMSEMFGTERKADMEKFVRENLALGVAEIVSKWVETNY